MDLGYLGFGLLGLGGMPICVDDRATNGVPFTFIYSAIFKRLCLRLPFTFFEKDLLTEMSVAPCQLHLNAWAFIRAFEILCNHFGHPPSTNVFLHLFEAKNPGDRSWVSLNGVSGRVILGLYQQSFKDWKGRFYMITSNEHNPTLLEGFPLYWVPKVGFKKPRGLEAMAPYKRELCGLLSSLGTKFGLKCLKCLRNTLVCLLFFPSFCYFSGYASSRLLAILAHLHILITFLHLFASLTPYALTPCHV